jgi:hypothetical protein
MDFSQVKIAELRAKREHLIVVFGINNKEQGKNMFGKATDNDLQIKLINDEILRESTILRALQSSLNVVEADHNSLELYHARAEIERIKLKLRKFDEEISALRSN